MNRFQYNGINYSTISTSAVQVGYGLTQEPYNSAVSRDYEGDINIPSYVVYSGKEYKVTKISCHAFYYCRLIKFTSFYINI